MYLLVFLIRHMIGFYHVVWHGTGFSFELWVLFKMLNLVICILITPKFFVMRLSLLPHPAEYEGTGLSHLSLLRLELVEQSAVKTHL